MTISDLAEILSTFNSLEDFSEIFQFFPIFAVPRH